MPGPATIQNGSMDDALSSQVGGDALEDFDPATADFGNDLEPSTTTEEPAHAPEPPETKPEEKAAPEESGDEETPAPGGEPAAEAAPESGPQADSDHRVPKSRLDREVARRRELEAALAAERAKNAQQQQSAQQQAKPTAPADLVAIIKQANELSLDGDTEGAAKLMAEHLVQLTTRAREEAIREVQGFTTQQKLQMELDAASERLWQEFPVLDNANPDFQPELVDSIVNMRDVLFQSGRYSIGEALEKATRLVIAEEAPHLLSKTTTAPAAPAKPAVDPKKLAAAAAQPVSPTKGGQSSAARPVLDITKLTEAEIDKLSEDELRQLRGDYLHTDD